MKTDQVRVKLIYTLETVMNQNNDMHDIYNELKKCSMT